MADYIYLLQNRLTPAQQSALQHIREAARTHGMTVFLVGGAVRDLTSGSPVRDLDVAVQGNATKLRKDLQKAGATLIGEHAPTQSIYFNFPGGPRVEVSATMSAAWPKPGKPVYKPANILDDLRRRDFTANAMAISLNDGSFGLLMDPLNGIADLENRELRLVSNYGFIEDPIRMVRAQRLSARLGWQLEEKTQQRYDTGKAEGYISALGDWERGYELEEILHEEDPIRVLRRLESEGWIASLFPALTAAKTNETELNKLRDLVGQLEVMGIFADPSAVQFPLLVAKLAPKDVAALKSMLARPGFVEQVAALEPATKTFAATFSGKTAALPSEAWKLLHATSPEVVLSLAYSSRSAPVQQRFTAFFQDWSQARNKVPYQLMQEMRITPDLPGYAELIEKLHFAIMDGLLDTPEAAKAYLEPYSPPAPPPPPTLRRRAAKRETKASKSKAKKAEAVETLVDIAAAEAPALPPAPTEAELEAVGAPARLPTPKKPAAKPEAAKPEPAKPVPAKPAAAKPAPAAPASAKKAEPAKPAPAKAVAAKPAVAKPVPASAPKPTAKPTPAKPATAKSTPAKAAMPAAKSASAPAAKSAPTKKAAPPAKAAKKSAPQAKAAAKKPASSAPAKKLPPKKVVAKKSPAKAAAKSPAKTAARKR